MKRLAFIFIVIAPFVLIQCDDILETKIDTNKGPVYILQEEKTEFRTLADMIKHYNRKTDSIDKVRIGAIKNGSDSIDYIDSAYYGIFQERNDHIYQYVQQHEKDTANLTGLIFLMVDKNIPIEKVESLYYQFPSAVRNSPKSRLILGKIEERKKNELITSYNLSLLTHRFESLEGDQFTLNQINSPFILLDFWASWCAPCRYENKILVRKKEEIFDEATITIAAISLDTDRNKWIKAVTEDQLNYLTVCDFKALESPLAQGLKIATVPYNILIDKKGNILAHNLWGDELKEFIKRLKVKNK